MRCFKHKQTYLDIHEVYNLYFRHYHQYIHHLRELVLDLHIFEIVSDFPRHMMMNTQQIHSIQPNLHQLYKTKN